jgi:membrane protein
MYPTRRRPRPIRYPDALHRPVVAGGRSTPQGIPVKAFATQLLRELKRNNVSNGAAALAFYLTLAIFPAMIFLMAVIPYLPIAHVDQAILDLLGQALPVEAARMLSSVVEEVTTRRSGALLSLGIVGTLWAASNGMYAVMQQMNVACDVEEGRPFLRARATALGLTLLFAVLVLGAFSLVVTGGIIQGWLGDRFGFSDALLNFFVVFRWVVIVLALLLAVAGIYYAAPNCPRRFRLLSPGTITATLLLIGASLAFRLYAAHFGDYDATYGSIGAVIVLMLWLYLAGFVMLLGAELDGALERRRQGLPVDTGTR